MEKDKKSAEVLVSNICSILGGALLLYPLIDEAKQTIIPEFKKIVSDDIKQLTDYQKDDEIERLKEKLIELESKLSEGKQTSEV